ncbi:hypothetical protein EV401DRAFT_1989085 [Pisolithus croceorrhizus]|nr:hypothetical protein EV401DRAFT_1989085 [Pisolithus croceorrhizus]
MAGFSHEFGSLDGKPATIQKVFSAFDTSAKQSFIDIAVVLFAEVFPVFSYILVSCVQSLSDMQAMLSHIVKKYLRGRPLVKSTEAEGELHVTPDEVFPGLTR